VLRAQSHSLAGIFIYCLPAGQLLWVAYRSLFRPFFLALAPSGLRLPYRAWPGPGMVDRRVGGRRAALVLGAATHVF
jgi:hypothetical protein